jgi:hypothetical protein
MARSFLPDPLELLRQAVNRLEGRANTLAGRGMEIDQLMKTLQQMSGLSLALRQALEMAMEGAYKRLNLPSSREFAEMKATLQRLEDKLDSLLAAQVVSTPRPPRPPRPRKPAAESAAAQAAKPRKTTAASRRRTAP